MQRLELLASLTKGCDIVCDIGCDHAYVIVEALKKYGCKRGIAADIAEGPLKTAKENIMASGLLDRVSLIQSDGFLSIDMDFDCAVIAGMGGYLIQDIIQQSLDKVRNKRLILEANTDQAKLREFLVQNGFRIEDEYAIMDMDKYYEIFVVNTGTMVVTKEEIEFGPILLKKKEEAFINHYKKKANMLMDVLLQVKNETVKEKKKEELERIKKYVLNEK